MPYDLDPVFWLKLRHKDADRRKDRGGRGFMFKNNVISLEDRLKKKLKKKKSSRKAANKKAKAPQKVDSTSITDITGIRQEMLKEERREVKRTILTGFIGAFAVIPQKGLLRVSVYDISESGIAFDVNEENGFLLKAGEPIAMRIYLNQQTYFPFLANIYNIRTIPEENVVRFGAGFVEGTINVEAIKHFIKFMESVSASLQKDTGDVMVSNLKKY
ncbi:MAG: PilZ domain-containing protein [Bdellovibrio sp.]|nr:MAG: PilZ domain-containing protein [Bdellovibrio sp.]